MQISEKGYRVGIGDCVCATSLTSKRVFMQISEKGYRVGIGDCVCATSLC